MQYGGQRVYWYNTEINSNSRGTKSRVADFEFSWIYSDPLVKYWDGDLWKFSTENIFKTSCYTLSRKIHIEWQSKHNYIPVIYKVLVCV